MKKVISHLKSLKSSLKRWVGVKAQSSTSQPSVKESCCERFDQQTLKKLATLLDENRRLKEEIRLMKLEQDRSFDV